MINEVYTTVLNILNKDSRGYITPQEFNNYAKLAQLSIFEDLFHEYAKSLVKQNNRLYHSEFSDIPRHIREVIDIFTKETAMSGNSGVYAISDLDFYRLIEIFANGFEVEEVSKTHLKAILRNNLTQPSTRYPVYVKAGEIYNIYPNTVQNVTAVYVRKPKDPKWTYTAIGGNAIYNPSANDLQDFELPYSHYNDLVVKILMYCGVQIREEQIAQLSMAGEQQEQAKEQL